MAVAYIDVTKDGYAAGAGETLIESASLLVMEPRVGHPEDPTWLTYVDCPLGSIPAGSTITDVWLYLTGNFDPSGDIFGSYATEDWTESGTAPARDVAELGVLSRDPTSRMHWSSSLIQAWLDGAITNYGAVIWPGNPWYQAYPSDFQSSEASYGPVWVITYETGEDETDPVVAVTTPADEETVNGQVTIIGTATDDVGVTVARCYIDGQALDEVLWEPNYGSGWRWTWDTSSHANGEHTIEIRAWDAAGNMGSDSITVTLDNNLADLERVLYTDVLNLSGGRLADLAIETLDAEDPPANPGQTYNVDLFCHVPGDSINLAEYQPLEPDRSHGFAAQGDSVRWALRARPLEVLSYYELTAGMQAIAMCEYTNSRVAILADTPNIDVFDGSTVEDMGEDLTIWSGTPTSIAYVDGKLLVGMGNTIVVIDLDSGQETFSIDLPGVTSIRAIEPRGTTQAWIAADRTGGGRLFSFSYPAVTQVGDLDQILCLEPYGSAVAIGTAAGEIYVSYGSTPALAYDTGEDDVRSLHYMSAATMMLAGTGSMGRVFRSAPAWAQDADFGFTDVYAIEDFKGKAYAGGSSAQLWRRDAADTWAQDRILAGTSNIWCMLSYTDPTDAECLLIGTDGAPARLYRLELSNAGQLQCGVDPPDLLFKVLRSVES